MAKTPAQLIKELFDLEQLLELVDVSLDGLTVSTTAKTFKLSLHSKGMISVEVSQGRSVQTLACENSDRTRALRFFSAANAMKKPEPQDEPEIEIEPADLVLDPQENQSHRSKRKKRKS
jgi:hypothetical protein